MSSQAFFLIFFWDRDPHQGPAGPQGPTGLPGTGVLNGTNDFTSNGSWTATTGVTRVIVEVWGSSGGWRLVRRLYLRNARPGRRSRVVLPQCCGRDARSSLCRHGRRRGHPECRRYKYSVRRQHLRWIDEVMQLRVAILRFRRDFGRGAQIGHSGAAGVGGTNTTCAASGGARYPIQGFSTTLGAGGSGAYSTSVCSVRPSNTGQNGYAVLIWSKWEPQGSVSLRL